MDNMEPLSAALPAPRKSRWGACSLLEAAPCSSPLSPSPSHCYDVSPFCFLAHTPFAAADPSAIQSFPLAKALLPLQGIAFTRIPTEYSCITPAYDAPFTTQDAHFHPKASIEQPPSLLLRRDSGFDPAFQFESNMTTETNAHPPAYLSPLAGNPYGSGSSLSRRSTTSSRSGFSTPVVESPRTLCPRDGDAFSYKLVYVSDWEPPVHLRDRLPSAVQAKLTALTHAGAAVLSGFERLNDLDEPLRQVQQEKATEGECKLAASTSSLSPLQLPGNAAGSLDNPMVLASSVSMPSEETITSPVSSSHISDTLDPHEDSMTTHSPIFPVSPICLTPSEMSQPHKRERSFSVPLEPSNAYYANELSHLRTEAVPRLRHSVRKTDTEWYEAKRKADVTEPLVTEFESWFKEKKLVVQDLYDQVKRKSQAIGLSPTGMGWQAP